MAFWREWARILAREPATAGDTHRRRRTPPSIPSPPARARLGCRIRPRKDRDERLEAAFLGFRGAGVPGLRRAGTLSARGVGGDPAPAAAQGASGGDRPGVLRAAAGAGGAGGGAPPRAPPGEPHVRCG